MDAQVALSAFGDEISDELSEQIDTLVDLKIRYLELRGVWGKNVLELSDAEVRSLRDRCQRAGIEVSAIGSPIGKSPLGAPVENELDNLVRVFDIASALDVQYVRVFSFYPPEAAQKADTDANLVESADRLSVMATRAADQGVTLLLENEKGIVGDTIAHCHALLTAVENPALRFAWDPANFVQVGEHAPTEDGWSRLGPYVAHVHVKDATVDGDVRLAGQGDSQVDLLLDWLRDSGYSGYLALEPHLVIAGHSSGFSGVAGMTRAVDELRGLMDRQRIVES